MLKWILYIHPILFQYSILQKQLSGDHALTVLLLAISVCLFVCLFIQSFTSLKLQFHFQAPYHGGANKSSFHSHFQRKYNANFSGVCLPFAACCSSLEQLTYNGTIQHEILPLFSVKLPLVSFWLLKKL